MAVYRGPLPQDNFTSIANDWVRDPAMKLSERGLLVYIASHKPGYKLTVVQMIEECANSRDAVYSALQGLRRLGYLRVIKHRAAKGHITEVDYELVDPTLAAEDAPDGVGETDAGTTSGKAGSSTTSGKAGSGQAGSGQATSGKTAPKKNISKKTIEKKTSTTELTLVEGGGESADSKPTRARPRTKLDRDWKPDLSDVDKMAAELSVHRDALWDWHLEFVDYWIGEGRTKADWLSTWRNWMRRANRDRGSRPRRPASSSTTFVGQGMFS